MLEPNSGRKSILRCSSNLKVHPEGGGVEEGGLNTTPPTSSPKDNKDRSTSVSSAFNIKKRDSGGSTSSNKVSPEGTKEKRTPPTSKPQFRQEDDDEGSSPNKKKKVQILQPSENSPGSSSGSSSPSAVSLSEGGGVVDKEPLKLYKSSFLPNVFDWDEIIEDIDEGIEASKTKSELYLMNGEPLKRRAAPGGAMGLHVITGEVMGSYGLEFLSMVSEVLETAFKAKLRFPHILAQLPNINYRRPSGQKLIIWIEEEEENDDPNDSLGRLLLTELLRMRIEPDVVIPCNDVDIDLIIAMINQVKTKLSFRERISYGADNAKFAEQIMLQFLLIGFGVTLACQSTQIIVIDAEKSFDYEQGMKGMIQMAEKELGHKVLYLRNTLKTMQVEDKFKLVQTFGEKVNDWYQQKNLRLKIDYVKEPKNKKKSKNKTDDDTQDASIPNNKVEASTSKDLVKDIIEEEEEEEDQDQMDTSSTVPVPETTNPSQGTPQEYVGIPFTDGEKFLTIVQRGGSFFVVEEEDEGEGVNPPPSTNNNN